MLPCACFDRQNELTELPSELGDLLDLRTLGVSSNKLTSLPASLGRLLLLEYLFANGNKLHLLPPELAELVNLKKVTLAAVSVNRIMRSKTKLAYVWVGRYPRECGVLPVIVLDILRLTNNSNCMFIGGVGNS